MSVVVSRRADAKSAKLTTNDLAFIQPPQTTKPRRGRGLARQAGRVGGLCCCWLRAYVPTASATHFFMWLVFAAPASFFSLESASQAVPASFSHLVMKLFRAAPASFLSAASDLQVANAGPDMTQTASTNAILFMGPLLGCDEPSLSDRSRKPRQRQM